MNHDSEHLRLLAIFHYVVSGLAVLFSFFPLLYSAMGGFMLYAAHHPGPHNQEPPPAIVGWIFIVFGAPVLSRRSRDGDLYSDRRPITRATTSLLVRIRDGMYRMSFHAFWDDSWRLYDHRALARIGEGAVFNPRGGALKLAPMQRLERSVSG